MNIKKHINSADIVILLGVLAVIASLIFRQPAKKLISEMFFSTEVTYSVHVFDASDNAFGIGTELFDVHGNNIGVVADIQSGFSEALITVNTPGMRDETGVFIADSMFIAAGLEIEIYSPAGL